MKDLNGSGITIGVIAWVVIMYYMATQSACLQTDTCGGGDMFFVAVIGLGMLAPSWIAAMFASAMFQK